MTEPPEADPTAGPAGSDAWRLDTLAVRAGLDRSPHDETAEALYLTSGYVYASAEEAAAAFAGDIDRYSYSRVSNPTVTMLQERLRALEGAEACWATATGMAAVFNALVASVQAGDRIVAGRGLFGSCFAILENLLPRFDVHTTFVDGPDLDQWEQAIADAQPAAVFFETPSNPMQELVDIAAVADLAHGAGARVIVDNVFATPLGQRPLELGADVVVYSTTKHIDGQGRTLGGAILGDEMFMLEHLTPFMRNTGPTISPFNAWVALKGLETLRLRVERMEATAIELATWLEGQPGVTWVRHPKLASHPQHDLATRQMTNGGSIVTLELDGGKDRAFAFVDALRMIDISNNLGDTKSLVTHPATTTHHRMGVGNRTAMGITDGVVRLSIGLEDVQDLHDDLARALSTSS
jgi:O-succinylhomoserine sulfhydrylase